MNRFDPLKYVLIALVGFFAVVAFSDRATSQQSPVRDGVFIHLSHASDAPQRALMALKMATVMSADRDVLIYMDISAVELAVEGAAALTKEPFDSSETMIDALLEQGVTLMVCPTCLEAAGKSPDDLKEGIRMAEKDAFFTFTKGRILSLDY